MSSYYYVCVLMYSPSHSLHFLPLSHVLRSSLSLSLSLSLSFSLSPLSLCLILHAKTPLRTHSLFFLLVFLSPPAALHNFLNTHTHHTLLHFTPAQNDWVPPSKKVTSHTLSHTLSVTLSQKYLFLPCEKVTSNTLSLSLHALQGEGQSWGKQKRKTRKTRKTVNHVLLISPQPIEKKVNFSRTSCNRIVQQHRLQRASVSLPFSLSLINF